MLRGRDAYVADRRRFSKSVAALVAAEADKAWRLDGTDGRPQVRERRVIQFTELSISALDESWAFRRRPISGGSG
jgi:hypothetical protein